VNNKPKVLELWICQRPPSPGEVGGWVDWPLEKADEPLDEPNEDPDEPKEDPDEPKDDPFAELEDDPVDEPREDPVGDAVDPGGAPPVAMDGFSTGSFFGS
jgi:hypothetical protein